MSATDPRRVARIYQDTKERITSLVCGLDDAALDIAVTACPDAAAHLDHLAESRGVEPPVGDIVSHEQDVRAVLGKPGARGSAAVRYSSDRLLTNLRTPVPLRVTVEDAEYRTGPDEGVEIRLCTTRFEALRWRTGRRSRAQLAAMDWSDDPARVLDHLCMFGPAATDIDE